MGNSMAVGRKGKGGAKTSARKGGRGSEVLFFRSLKRALFGKSRKKSMDLLDKWILKKNPLGLFL